MNPDGQAMLKAAEYLPPHELPSEDFPFQLITGRTLYHFHTRTKTGRAPQLQAAAPEVWVEMSAARRRRPRARRRRPAGGQHAARPGRGAAADQRDPARRGVPAVPLRLLGQPGGHEPTGGHGRAANELTITDWDPVSKQPIFKTAAAPCERMRRPTATPSAAPTTTASAPVAAIAAADHGAVRAARGRGAGRTEAGVKLDLAIEELHRSENDLSPCCCMSDRHKAEHEVFHVTRDMARWSAAARRRARRGRPASSAWTSTPRRRTPPGMLEPLQQKTSELLGRRSAPGLLLLADLRHLYREAAGTSLDWELLAQGAQGARNKELLDFAERCHPQTLRVSSGPTPSSRSPRPRSWRADDRAGRRSDPRGPAPVRDAAAARLPGPGPGHGGLQRRPARLGAPSEDRIAGLVAVLATVPLQLLAAVMGFLARDPVAATGMGVLAGTWGVVGLTTLTSPPGATSEELGVLLITAGLACWSRRPSARAQARARRRHGRRRLRFLVTGGYQLTASAGWKTAAGWVGLALASSRSTRALALELEGAEGRTVLPVGRHGPGRLPEAPELLREPGVRAQL